MRPEWIQDLGRIGLAIAGLLVGLLLAEVGVRFAQPRGYEFFMGNWPSLYDTSIFQPDDDIIQVLRPGAVGHMNTPEYRTEVHINSDGLRGPEVQDIGGIRVLAVGDSFTLAHQVTFEQSFSGLLSQRLSDELGQPVQVLDGGVDSYGTWEALGYARRLAARVHPDVVLLTVFLGNDLNDNAAHRSHKGKQTVVENPPLPWWDDTLGRWSMLYHEARALAAARALARNPGGSSFHTRELMLFVEPTTLRRELVPTQEALQDFADFTEEIGVDCVVAVAPPAFTVYPRRAAATFKLYGIQSDLQHLDDPAVAVTAAVPAPCVAVDLSPALHKAAQDGPPLYFRFDGHWTAEGHRVAVGPMDAALRQVLAAE